MASMLTESPFLFLLMILAVLSHLANLSLGYQQESLRIDLVHRDSPIFPFYSASDTKSNWFRNAMLHTNGLHGSSSGQGIYLVKIFIGNPPSQVLLAVDTQTMLSWIQYQHCQNCYKQNAPKKSSTYKEVPCWSNLCPHSCIDNRSKSCVYQASYSGNSYTSRTILADTLIIALASGQSIAFPEFILGCGHNNSGSSLVGDSFGVLGLSNGPTSFMTQLGYTTFSYCLAPIDANSTSALHISNHTTSSSKGIVSTPLVVTDMDTHYHITLEGVSIGNKRLENALSVWEGNMIMDCATTVSKLPSKLYNMIESELKKAIKLKQIEDPSGAFKLCYSGKADVKVPVLTFHFTRGDLNLNKSNTFVHRDLLLCFAFVPDNSLSIFGNLVQTNYEVEYDHKNMMLSFAQADCRRS